MAKKRKIAQLKDGKLVKEYSSIQEAAISLGLHKSSICEVLKKRRYKTTGGFTFEYVEDTIPGEEWRTHQLGRQVSNIGRIEDLNGLRSFGVVTRLKYRRVQVGNQKYFVHRLVLEAFVGNCPEGMECDHIDRNRSNNRIENLRWITVNHNRSRKRIRTIKSEAL